MTRLEWSGRAEAEQVCWAAEIGGVDGQFPVIRQIDRGRMICQDNLLVLREFLKSPQERFHFIYIDPPYNTGTRRGKGLAYNDRLGQNSSEAWLSMIYPRLVLSREVLLDRGIICVSIDEREHAHLMVLLSEIYGRENHIVTIKWRKKRKPSFLSSHASSVFEYIVVFAKNARILPRLRGKAARELSRPVLNAGNPWAERIIRRGTAAKCGDGILQPGRRAVRTLSFELLDALEVKNGAVLGDCRVRGPFRVSQEVIDQTVFVTKNWGLRRSVGADELGFQHFTDDGSDWPTNEDGDQEILQLYGTRVFPFAKPVSMLLHLIEMYPIAEKDMHFLDFFAGSGSFGEAVMRANALDGLKRRFTLVQIPEEYVNAAVPNISNLFELMCDRISRCYGTKLAGHCTI